MFGLFKKTSNPLKSDSSGRNSPPLNTTKTSAYGAMREDKSSLTFITSPKAQAEERALLIGNLKSAVHQQSKIVASKKEGSEEHRQAQDVQLALELRYQAVVAELQKAENVEIIPPPSAMVY